MNDKLDLSANVDLKDQEKPLGGGASIIGIEEPPPVSPIIQMKAIFKSWIQTMNRVVVRIENLKKYLVLKPIGMGG
jgi:hypothetical protein